MFPDIREDIKQHDHYYYYCYYPTSLTLPRHGLEPRVIAFEFPGGANHLPTSPAPLTPFVRAGHIRGLMVPADRQGEGRREGK